MDINLTITSSIKINNGANANIDDTKETLILLLELLLVKYLNRQYTVFTRPPVSE